MSMIDMTHRKLHFPPRFLPYLEKHRIFELLHECVELLIQMRPNDHIKFLKNVLPCAAMKKDKQRIVFLSPPSFDREFFSQLLADCLGIHSITIMYLELLTRERLIKELKPESSEKTEEEEEEEESCICPGEGYVFPEEYLPLYAGEEEIGGEEEEYLEMLQKKEICEKDALQPEEPCVCVCPCVKEEEERKKKQLEEEEEGKGDGVCVGDEKEVGGECIGKEEEAKKKKKKCLNKKEQIQEYRPCRPPIRQVTTPCISSDLSSKLGDDVQTDFGILGECETSARGWILQDFPRSGKEAKKLNSIGVIPTHALRLIINEEEEANDPEYQSLVRDWTKAYKFVPVLEIRVKERSLEELVQDMCSLLSLMPHRHAPMLPRIVLIGSRGSGVTTQGQKLASKYGYVHVEFEIVIAQALQQDDEITKLYKLQLATRPDPELEAYILEKALLTSACRNRGWVLTGYPRNIDQMRMLDIIATPPNRVIFVEVPPRECFVRLFYRKTDPCLGDEYKIPVIVPFGLDSFKAPNLEPEVVERLMTHPKNNKKQIIHDIEQYTINKQAMMAYCGKTAFYVDGDREPDKVLELIEQIIVNSSPPHPPREPLAINQGIDESLERLKKYRLVPGMLFNNLLLNPPERKVIVRF